MDLCCPYRAGAAVPQSQSVRRVGDRGSKFSEQVAVLEVVFKLPEEFRAEVSPNSRHSSKTRERLPIQACAAPIQLLFGTSFNLVACCL